MRQLKHGDKIRFIVETGHFEKGFETIVSYASNDVDMFDGFGEGFFVMGTARMICGPDANIQYLQGEHWEFVD